MTWINIRPIVGPGYAGETRRRRRIRATESAKRLSWWISFHFRGRGRSDSGANARATRRRIL